MKGGDSLSGMKMLLWGAMALLTAACASIGRPEGGPRDEKPPVFRSSDPMPGATNVSRTKLTVYFDENIQLEDAFSKVVVSPAQQQPPQISANGRRLTVELRDTLRDSTTYTVDFADAIKDLNEGNILDGFAIDFSTGPTIDTLRISGMVLQAENLEPAQGMLVGVYSNMADSAVKTLPLERIARTNQLGQFTIRNLPAGEYRIFAINDLNRDYHWDRSEDIAFFDTIISPSVESITVTDTLYSMAGTDSLASREGVRYLPNDILLTWFNENYKSHYLSDYKRPERRKITLGFGAPNDTLPRVDIVSGAPGIGRDISEWALMKANATLDTLEYWISDPDVVASDSLRLAVTYQKTDTLDRLVWNTDTLRFFFREPKKKKKKESEEPRFVVDSVSGDTTFLPPPDFEYLSLRARTTSMQDLGRPFVFETSLPLASLDTAAVHLELKVDSLWQNVPFKILPDSLDPLLVRKIEQDWKAGETYRFTVDTLAAVSIYGPWNKPFSQEFKVKQPEDYANLFMTVAGLDSVQVVVELLSSGDQPVRRAIKPVGASRAEFRLVDPGKYYARLFIDENMNGKWDTGSMSDSIAVQPEEVFYYSKTLNLKKNWDIEQTWDPYELPVDMQKPYAIKKNKPKLKRGEKAPTDEEEEYDEFGNPIPADRRGSGNRGSGNRGTGNMGGFGGFGGRNQSNGTSLRAQ